MNEIFKIIMKLRNYCASGDDNILKSTYFFFNLREIFNFKFTLGT